MDKLSLTAMARQQLKLAAASSNGRSSQTVLGGHTKHLRQTVIALLAGHELGEHDSPPGEATLQVLTGQLSLIAGGPVVEGIGRGISSCSRRPGTACPLSRTWRSC